MARQRPKPKRLSGPRSVKNLLRRKQILDDALAAETIASLPVHVVHELRSIGEALSRARNTAATVCIALPNARLRVNDWEMANTLYECNVRILDAQVKRIEALLGLKQP